MTTATSAPKSETDIFRHQARVTSMVLHLNLDAVTQKESLIQPQPEGNCLNWVVGHLVCIYNNFLPLLKEEPVVTKEVLERYDRGTPPLRNGEEAMDIGELIAIWDKASSRVESGLANLSTDDLDAHAPFSPTNDPNETVRSLISTVCFHQAYHAGQTGTLRRIAGKPGAIA